MQITPSQKLVTLRVIKITVVLVPVIGGAIAAYLTGSPFDWVKAVQTVLPVLLGQ